MTVVGPVAFSPDGRRLAAASITGPPEDRVIRVWDLESGGVRVIGSFPGVGGDVGGVGADVAVADLSFLDDNRLLACSPTSGVILFDLRGGAEKKLSSRPGLAVTFGRRKGVLLAVLGKPDELVRLDLEGRETQLAPCPGCTSVALDPTETMVATSAQDGTVRIGPVSGGAPHLFLGHTSEVFRVAFSPDGQWVASGADDNTARLWPVPDITKTPFHLRSHAEVLGTLRSWTNLRAVPDAQAPTGWKLEPGPFPGWKTIPEW